MTGGSLDAESEVSDGEVTADVDNGTDAVDAVFAVEVTHPRPSRVLTT